MSVLTLSQMLEAGVHFGHQTRRWNPKMRPYIFTERNGIHVIDLTLTAQYLEQAYGYLQQASNKGKKVLFVGTKRQAASVISQEAARCGMYWVNQRWLGGMLTNWTTIKTVSPRKKPLPSVVRWSVFRNIWVVSRECAAYRISSSSWTSAGKTTQS
jgi:small subunit ribosomal protein S2